MGLIGRGVAGMTAAAPSYVKAPRFVFYVNNILNDLYRIEVVELKPGSTLPFNDVYHVPFSSIDIIDIEQVLTRTKLVPVEECIEDYIRAERVVKALNNMDLALQAAELEPNGIKNLFDQLWSSDL
jgi:hypothetical protein